MEYDEFATEPALVRAHRRGRRRPRDPRRRGRALGRHGHRHADEREIYNAPPVLLLTGRPQDAWLATWSQAEAVVPHPIDPVVLAATAAALLRPRVAVTSA